MTPTHRSTITRDVPTWVYLAALAAVAVAARLPQLLSPNLLLEGDECILGLMGMHLAQGREFPIFFYGQKYGLSVVEAPAAALSFSILGVGAVPLKLAMLAVWTAGLSFYFLAFARPLGVVRSFSVALLLALLPAGAASSMKASGGYVTAFLLTGAAVYLITRNDNRRRGPWLVVGALSGIIYFAQPLWLPSLAPIVLYFLVASRRLAYWISFLSGVAAVLAGITAIKVFWLADAVEIWTTPSPGNPQLIASLPRVLNQAYVALTGSYYFGTAVETGPVTAALAYLWLAVFAVALLGQVYRIVTRKYLLWAHLLFVSVCSTLLANWLLLESRDARYVLAVYAPLAFLAGWEVFDLADRWRVSIRRRVAAILLVLAVHAVAMIEFRDYTYMWWTNSSSRPSEARTLQTVIGHLQSRGVRHAYATNALLQWSITFYSRESVIARWKPLADRYPPYIREVDRALDAGEPIAIVGYVGYTYGLEELVRDPQSIIDVDGKYFVYVGADKSLLRRAGFQIR